LHFWDETKNVTLAFKH
jgi:hypothetical protein